jgi:Tol biopolymer transport system component
VRTLAAAGFSAAALLGGAHGATPSLIAFAADRASSVTGDVFRVDANHRVVNLTHSPWQEKTPTVSPNGKLVAFVSDRYGGSLWTVGTDGKGLRRLQAGGFPTQFAVEMVWSPDSATLAYTTGGTVSNTVTLWIARPRGASRALSQRPSLFRPSWSPDGRLLTVETNPGAVQAFTAAGSRAWSVSSGFVPVGWSATGLFATGQYDGRIHVIDESGKQRFSIPATTGAWSPDGKRLATMRGHRGEVWTSAGRLVSTHRYVASDNQPTWTSATHVVFGPAPSVGPNTVRTRTTFAVRNGTRVYTHVPGCDDDGGPVAAIQWLQAVPRSTSLVYQSDCAEPLDNLYAINPDGTGLRRITTVQANQVKPSISPDRTRIAFGESQYAGLSCKGCPESLRTIRTDGTAATTLTSPPDCTFDDSPSWSPDGTQIMFVHSACDTAPGAYVVAAGGGTPKSLNVPAWTVAWGPTRIAYADGRTAPTSLWTALPDGTNRQRVAGIGAGLTTPAWSADGRLAYVVGTTAFVQGKKVPLPFAQVRSLVWSPDGTRLLVAAKPKKAPTFDLYTVRTDGTDVHRLTQNLDVSSADWR